MIQGGLRFDRQTNAPIVHSKHNAWWVGVLVSASRSFFFIRWVRMPDQSGLALLGYWFGVVLGVTALGIGLFSLLREVAPTFELRSNRLAHHLRMGGGWYERRSKVVATSRGRKKTPMPRAVTPSTTPNQYPSKASPL